MMHGPLAFDSASESAPGLMIKDVEARYRMATEIDLAHAIDIVVAIDKAANGLASNVVVELSHSGAGATIEAAMAAVAVDVAAAAACLKTAAVHSAVGTSWIAVH